MKITFVLVLFSILISNLAWADSSPAPSSLDLSKIVSLSLGDLQILIETPALHERMIRLDEQTKAINQRLMDQIKDKDH